ncbi:NarK/NasA family nitrate transporter [Halalkalibacterium halodurans]|uniref:nitrate/nitrite transporter n=1 Tax=Halalkalibacterium halodurans TaxID=86665 RepID=UPI002E246118|nr:NarK/NasA family nitrate transporter [Halalkalibacterium halodurans]MED4086685.1 NarK/NasA family nitrate transporter [Halalkalibacterium halodurans]MED4103261.1 NarK/NasA family nitrate transporter [Halalkalibacterium halodurans]MED4108874.1 NarK/NasA family nitrate transporter [Halalkalibacterium halodurans]MED4148611.1 NarK/NasA family nitrate transporter [Halalkalibacterium halodurans]
MSLVEIFRFRNERIKILHLTWIAFFISFFTWFNMAPLATTMMESMDWLTREHIAALAIINVALTIPARLIIGMLLDRFGPRIVYSSLLVLMAIPAFMFAFGDTWTQLMISRLLLSSIGASFVVGIRMVAEWFPPKDVGFAEGIYGGWGNFGSAVAAMVLPWFAITMFGGPEGWRYAMAFTGVVCLIYGVIYYLFVRDTPEGKTFVRAKRTGAMEVSSWKDLIWLIVWTIPLHAALGVLAWRLEGMGYLSETILYTIYLVLAVALVYQVYTILKVNVPLLKKGIPEDDRYSFKNVAALNSTYFANFGAELAIISMLPMFFQLTFSLTPAQAGLIASSFAFINLFARPLGGILSDRMGSRRNIMLVYMAGITIGLVGMGFMDSNWPLVVAILITVFTSVFIQGAEGATFAVIPMIKKRMTGQVAGMAGAYGNVGATIYLTLYTFVTPQQFFFILAGGALASFVICYFWLEEPENSFASEYALSSVDEQAVQEAEVSEAEESVVVQKKVL